MPRHAVLPDAPVDIGDRPPQPRAEPAGRRRPRHRCSPRSAGEPSGVGPCCLRVPAQPRRIARGVTCIDPDLIITSRETRKCLFCKRTSTREATRRYKAGKRTASTCPWNGGGPGRRACDTQGRSPTREGRKIQHGTPSQAESERRAPADPARASGPRRAAVNATRRGGSSSSIRRHRPERRAQRRSAPGLQLRQPAPGRAPEAYRPGFRTGWH